MSFISKSLNEGKVYSLQNPNENLTTRIKIIQNPTKQQVQSLLNEDKYHIIRAFVTENDIFCWRGFSLTHQEALDCLLKQEGLEINPLCGIAFNEHGIQLANTWNTKNISEENKYKILHNKNLEYLFGKDYYILDL